MPLATVTCISKSADGGVHVTDSELLDPRVALSEFPELRGLADLVAAGWASLPTIVDGQVVQLHGVRMWPGGWVDAIRFAGTSDAMAVRCDHDGGLVWQYDGGLTEVIDSLVALPMPGTRSAPRLVKGAAPSVWVP